MFSKFLGNFNLLWEAAAAPGRLLRPRVPTVLLFLSASHKEPQSCSKLCQHPPPAGSSTSGGLESLPSSGIWGGKDERRGRCAQFPYGTRLKRVPLPLFIPTAPSLSALCCFGVGNMGVRGSQAATGSLWCLWGAVGLKKSPFLRGCGCWWWDASQGLFPSGLASPSL